MTTQMQPAVDAAGKALPFAQQPDEWKIDQMAKSVAGFVRSTSPARGGGMNRDQLTGWFLAHVTRGREDLAPAVLDAARASLAAQVAGYADAIMAAIAADVAAGTIPDGVTSFAGLHDHVDANEYVAEAGVPFGTDYGAGGDDGYELVNLVTAAVDARLAS